MFLLAGAFVANAGQDEQVTSPAGRGVAVVLMIAGIAMFGVITATIAAYFVEQKAEEDRFFGARWFRPMKLLALGWVVPRGAAAPRHRLGRAPPIASTGRQAERRACHPACRSASAACTRV